MDSGAQKHRVNVAIFGSGRVGAAMKGEMPGVPVLSRGEDAACKYALICWPAQAIREFAGVCPLASTAHKVSFCNGAWAIADGADEAGCCYARLQTVGAQSDPKRKCWRVGLSLTAKVLSQAGLRVVCSSAGSHQAHIWGKCLYLVPLALACSETGQPARITSNTSSYKGWYAVVRRASVAAIGEAATAGQEARVRFLVGRSPSKWTPSPSPEEIAYFKEKLCVASSEEPCSIQTPWLKLFS